MEQVERNKRNSTLNNNMELNDILRQCRDIIKPENKCSLEEAYNWLKDGFKREKEKYILSSYLLSKNLSQDIPFEQLYEDELDVILDDFDYLIEQAVILKGIVSLLYNAKHHPDQYNAYKGKVNGEIIYIIVNKNIRLGAEIYM